MNYSRLIAVAALIVLSACSSSHRPTYSGVQESTEGVPGFKNGKKVSPHVKLGQSYTVDGETYVPRNQPDYIEEGMASWYGPGFHGGKTANGEKFDANELTAAHRTLPLPSIVRVTMLSTGKQVYVRINDRGPFAHSRIIDLSRGAADKIGLLRSGVAKVRVEYMKKESERFAQLLEDGRDIKSIDIASEIIDYTPETGTQYARADTRMADYSAPAAKAEAPRSESFWDNFGSSPANAAEPTPEAAIEALNNDPISSETNGAAPVQSIASSDLAAPKASSAQPFAKAAPPPVAPAFAAPAPAPVAVTSNASPVEAVDHESPFAVLESAAGEPEPTGGVMEIASVAPAPVRTPMPSKPLPAGDKVFVQLGAFSNEANAARLKDKFRDVGGLEVVKKPNASGQTLYHVRMGPYNSAEASTAALDKVSAAGGEAKIVKE